MIDGNYTAQARHAVLDAADTVVWLDLPMRVWLPRLARRTGRRVNRARDALERQPGDVARRHLGPRSLFVYALTQHTAGAASTRGARALPGRPAAQPARGRALDL